MDAPKDGGPAFPHGTFQHGMTLRDYFAARAMTIVQFRASQGAVHATLVQIAQEAYDLADAMLKAREA